MDPFSFLFSTFSNYRLPFLILCLFFLSFTFSPVFAGSSTYVEKDETDYNGDGKPDRIQITEYDQYNNQISYSLDSNGDGKPEYEEKSAYVYDAQGRAVSIASQYQSQYEHEKIVISMEYDQNGNLKTEFEDNNGDGKNDSRWDHTVWDQGEKSTFSRDLEGDGNFTIVRESVSDAEGNPISEHSDYNHDGKWDQTLNYSYDDRGNLVQYSSEEALGDGTKTSSVTEYIHDDAGHVLQENVYENGSEKPSMVVKSRYDEAGRLLETLHDREGDGTPDRSFVLSRNEQGNVVLAVNKSDKGDVIFQEEKVYDPTGKILIQSKQSSNFNQEGKFSETITSFYNEQGWVIREITHFEGGNQPDEITTYEYDEHGRLLSFTTDRNGDGKPDVISKSSYKGTAPSSLETSSLKHPSERIGKSTSEASPSNQAESKSKDSLYGHPVRPQYKKWMFLFIPVFLGVSLFWVRQKKK